ncbi:MAG: hypothetical protein J5679_01545 [Alphaproteobacteria bacterium]|nr:hypothetical protein [Alphaproteobacteria bacterium]
MVIVEKMSPPVQAKITQIYDLTKRVGKIRLHGFFLIFIIFPLDFLYGCGILAQIIGGIAAEIGRYFIS